MKPFKYQLEFTGVSIVAAPALVIFLLIQNWQIAASCASVLSADFLVCAMTQYGRHRRDRKK